MNENLTERRDCNAPLPTSLHELQERRLLVLSEIEGIQAQLGAEKAVVNGKPATDAEWHAWRVRAKIALRHRVTELRRIKAAIASTRITESQQIQAVMALQRLWVEQGRTDDAMELAAALRCEVAT